MRVPMSWLREYAQIPAQVTVREVGDALVRVGLEVEQVEEPGSDLAGALVVGRAVSSEPETHSNGKTIRWCQVDVGEEEPRGIVCGADNFAAGDLVVVALPGTVLPGGFAISARSTYGHVSDGMICSARELGIGDDHSGIIVLTPDEAKVGDDAAAVLHLRDGVLDLAVTPDRGYCLSIRGVAREAAAAFDVPYTDPALRDPPRISEDQGAVRLDDPSGCDVFAAVTMEGFDPTAASPRWIQRRLQLAGMRPISLSVDVTNYVMLELGQPIHGYDADRLHGGIVVRRAGPGETLTTLDGTRRALDAEDLLITDDSGPIGLAGVMGGETTEMSGSTTRVLVEAAHFDPVSIARTARRHRLPSEASRRFERGVDPAIPAAAAVRVGALLTEFGGGRVVDVTLTGRFTPPPAASLGAGLSTRVLGMEVAPSTVLRCLATVGCEVQSLDDTFAVTPPTWRPDLVDPNDFVEEVARLVGYDAIPSVLPVAPAGRGLTREQRLRRRIGTALAGAGFVETLCYPFVGDRDWDALGLAPDDPRRTTVRVANPLSDEAPELRTTLLPGLLQAAARNLGRGQPGVSLFETGPTFRPRPGPLQRAPRLPVDRAPTEAELAALEAALPEQPNHVAVVVAGERVPEGWWGPARSAGWADAIQAVRVVATALGLNLAVRQARWAPWHPGRCAELLLDGSVVGTAGELHPKVAKAYGFPGRASAAEAHLDALFAAAPLITPAPRFSTQPLAKEDVALIVDADIPAAAVEAALRDGAGELLESVRLFDVYTGDQIGVGRKSLAFALRFRALDRTLTEGETAAARDAAVAAAAARTGAVQRV